ncbi:hypothetical protein [Candidatus Annandia pinicola]|uniref:hypothetical protein n=1 Tax=Candidatus Annandia pinicola TaxID=1345117 RepID=UPI001D0309DE|nr:hypothetical protein [Candidatus Annandia pinicola]UDG80541.1 Multifunctional CCA protein [Candidatus Annandia pinicola]
MNKYLVGGAVRDFILKIKIRDRDWLVIGATPKMMIDKGYFQVGKVFPIFIHPISKEEYSLARIETKIGKKNIDFNNNYDNKTILNEDLKRRDITINSIAMNKYGNFIDPCNGLRDIKKRVIRHISSVFKEDPLRIFRVASFAARLLHLNFYVSKKTILFMKNMIKKGDLKYIKAERIWKETRKALISNNPHIYFYILNKCGALKETFPEIYNSIKNKLKYNKNNEKAIINIFKIRKNSVFNVSVRFALFCLKFKINKVKLIKSICTRIKIPNKIANVAIVSTLYYDHIDNIKYRSSKYIINIFNKINAWNRPYIVKMMSIIFFLHKDKKKNKFSNSFFLYKYFYLIKNIDFKEAIKKKYDKSSINIALNNKRILYLNKFL